jgi:hypothetical protein
MNIFYILALLYHFTFCTQAQSGVIIRPVADIVGTGKDICKDHSAAGSAEHCTRMHQVLFNERVTVLETTDTACRIYLPNFFYLTSAHPQPQSMYWIDKNAVALIDSLPQECHTQQIFPEPYNGISAPTSITLEQPFYSDRFGMPFSAGTRFTVAGKHKRSYKVRAWHPLKKTIVTFNIPASACIRPAQTKEDQITTYHKLLLKWARAEGIIPYIWGGCSFSYTLPQHSSFRQEQQNNTIRYNYACDHHQPKQGFDCAGFIARAAQAAGLPYYCKNTAAIATYLKPVTAYEKLREGDLILIPGHVMAIGSLTANSVLEARHYNHGYGKVHEIALDKVFKDIKNFSDLFQAQKEGKPLERLNSSGKLTQKIDTFAILSITSCFD